MSAIQPTKKHLINGASFSVATSWLLTSSGVAVDTQTITIAGIVFTSVNAIGVTAGNVLVDASASAFITNLVTLINAPGTTTATGVALSATDQATIKRLGITAVKTSTTLMTLSSSVVKVNGIAGDSIVVSETETNFAWTTSTTGTGAGGNGFGMASIQFVAASITSGNAVFTVDVSNDSINWTAYNRMTTNVTNTNAQTDTRVASVTLNSNTTSLVTIPDPVAFFRVNCVVTTDGVYNAIAYVI